MIEEWQRIAADDRGPDWTGDLGDDSRAQWAGLLLRAEWEDGTRWWWAVTDLESGEEITSSNSQPGDYLSGEVARNAAERAARDYLGIPNP